MRSVFLAVIAGVLALALAPAANAAQVEPTMIAGNPSCEGGVKVDPVVDGTYGGITITTTTTDSGPEFAFSTDGLFITGVLVKGGPNANFYDYSAMGGVTSDSGLHSPVNKAKWYGLSHLCFFTDDKQPPPPPK